MAREMKYSGIEWIGDIPAEWEMKRLKAIFLERKEKNDPQKTDFILSLGAAYGVVPYSEKEGGGNKAKEDLTAYRLAYPDDIVMNSMNIISGSVGISKYFGCVSPVYYMLYPRLEGVNQHYYCQTFQTKAFQRSLLGLGNGILMKETESGNFNTVRMRIPMEKLGVQLLPFPKAEEQKRIADFLEQKCAEIDTVIDKTKATIEEYKKLKQSVVTEAITKGIYSNRVMKDSGIEWIGDIPAEWEIKTAFQLFAQVKNKNEGLVEKNLLSLSYGKIKRKSIDTIGGLLPESFDGYNIIEKDDIVLRLTDLQNDHTSLRVGLANERGIVTSAYITLRNRSKNTPLYLYYYLHTFDVVKGFYGMGAGVRQGLNWDGLKKLKIVTPPISEQEEITKFLEQKCAEIDTIIEQKTHLLEEMESYKKSVIYEYVTGKKEVVL